MQDITHEQSQQDVTKQEQLRDAYYDKLNAEVDKAQAHMDALRAKAREATADARIEAMRELDEAESYYDKLQGQLRDLRRSSGEAWQEFKSGCDASWRELENAMRRAADKFKQ